MFHHPPQTRTERVLIRKFPLFFHLSFDLFIFDAVVDVPEIFNVVTWELKELAFFDEMILADVAWTTEDSSRLVEK